MFRINARLIMPNEQDLLQKFGLQPGGRVQHTLNAAIIRDTREYVPAGPNGILAGSVMADDENGLVIWNTPYAHYQYAGIVYGPNIPIIDPKTGVIMGWFSPPRRPKHPTDRELTYDTSQNHMAGPYWFERAKADHLNGWLDEAQKAIENGGE